MSDKLKGLLNLIFFRRQNSASLLTPSGRAVMISCNYVVCEICGYVETPTRLAKTAAFQSQIAEPMAPAVREGKALLGTGGRQIVMPTEQEITGFAAGKSAMKPLLTLKRGGAARLLDLTQGGNYPNRLKIIADENSSALWQVPAEDQHDALPFYR
jgi:hypothetical protein